jgi:pimeloyl-ACP methyl ester carboxylesterase
MGITRVLRNGATVIGLGAAAGAAFITVRHLLNTPQPLSSGLPGAARIDRRHGGDLYYNIAGPADGEPLLLLHDFYPGASNFEYRAVFSALADHYRVYAPDWLGFGMSEHPNIAYTGEFYSHMLTGFLRDVVARPAIVVAHGHAANIAVRAASDMPALIDRLILIAPEGAAGLREGPTLGQTLVRLTQRAMLGMVPYAILSTMPALRWFSRQTVGPDGEAAAEDLYHRYASSHQFGGQYAPLALLTGELDLPIQQVFPLLEQPSLIISGEDDPFHPPEEMEDLAILNPRADLDILPDAGTAVLAEHPGDVLHQLAIWLSGLTHREIESTASAKSLNAEVDNGDMSSMEAAEVSDVASLGKVETDPQMTSLAADTLETSTTREPETSPGNAPDSPSSSRPTTRAMRRSDRSIASTRVPLQTGKASGDRSRATGGSTSTRQTGTGRATSKRTSSSRNTSGQRDRQ